MKLVDNFYNKLAEKIRKDFFPNVEFYRDDKQCEKACYVIELFNNGAVNYKYLINYLSLICKTSDESMHEIVKEFIENFEGYVFRPKKKGMKITFEINDDVVKIFTDRGVKKKDISKIYMHIIEEELGQNSHFRNDFITEWFDENDFREVLQ